MDKPSTQFRGVNLTVTGGVVTLFLRGEARRRAITLAGVGEVYLYIKQEDPSFAANCFGHLISYESAVATVLGSTSLYFTKEVLGDVINLPIYANVVSSPHGQLTLGEIIDTEETN